MTISDNADTLKPVDSLEITVKVPAVKLYDRTVKFSATVFPQANFTFNFPQGDSLNSYPDSVILKIISDNVPPDTYTVTVEGKGPNGTPVHRRTITLLVTNPLVEVVQPNGGEELFIGTLYPIKWDKIFVDVVKLEYSTDGGGSWIPIDEGLSKSSNMIKNPKYKIQSQNDRVFSINSSQLDWIVPNTVSDNCLIRISDKNDSTLFDVSNSTFSIVAGPLPNWRAQISGIDSSIISVSVVDTTFAWAGTTDGSVLRTTDGGNNWTVVNSSQNGDISSIAAVNDLKAFIVVNSPSGTKIRRTLIGGISWSTVYEDTTTGAYINAIKMFDENTGYAIGDPVNGEWQLLTTTNGGTDWTSAATLLQDGSETGWNNSMDWIGDQFGWFGTDNGHIYRTTDGGATWTASQTTFSNSIAVSFVDEMTGLAGGNGTDRTTDGGASWNTSPVQLPGVAFGSAAVNLSQGRWYFITGGEIYKTFDHGDNFSLDFVQSDVYQDIDMKVVKIGENYWLCGYAVGENGTITKYLELYTVTDIAANSDLVPDKFLLMQNYPNPFNPTTKIKFTIRTPLNPTFAKGGKTEGFFVSLKVYDVLGNEVATLVNGKKPAGSYEVEFDASKLSSGIYFYRLYAGSFIETKKMVLLR